MHWKVFLLFVFCDIITNVWGDGCKQKDFGHGSFVCVCDESFCDAIENVGDVSSTSFVTFTSTKDGQRLRRDEGTIEDAPAKTKKRKEGSSASDKIWSWFQDLFRESDTVDFHVYQNEERQPILGFGGAFTDAACINAKSMGEQAQKRIIESYFSSEGIGYTFGRVPMGGSDFSTKEYTYNDGGVDDFAQNEFKLQPEDTDYKIPIIQEAQKISKRPLKLFGSLWSPPAWMKTNGRLSGMGRIKGPTGGKYYESLAIYYLKFIESYAKNNIKMWAVTGQNEPTDGLVPFFPFNCVGFFPWTYRNWIAKSLGPALRQSAYKDTKLLIFDESTFDMKLFVPRVLRDAEANNYTDGVAFHWYFNGVVPYSWISDIHDEWPDKLLLSTEASAGLFPWEGPDIILGSWERGEQYFSDILKVIENWGNGWVDWNMATDMEGGPSWAKTNLDSPIIVDKANNVFYRQPMFYALGHFSKFVVPDSRRILTTGGNRNVFATSARTPDGKIVMNIINKGNTVKAVISDIIGKKIIRTELPPRSFRTIIWNALD